MRKIFIFMLFMGLASPIFAKENLPRTIVTTDGEIDDVDTFIRMLLYSNEFHLEGLIYSSSMWHYKGDGKGTLFTSEMDMTKKMYGAKTDLRWPGVNWIQDLLKAYGEVYPKLSQNSKTYPSPAYLNSLVKVGNIDFEGEMNQITPGSEWIKAKLLDNDPQPIFLQAWGGTNTIARALKSIEEAYSKQKDWPIIQEKISKKAIIYTVMDQDATYKKYIGLHWPKIRVFYNAHQFGSFAYPWKRIMPKAAQPYFEGPFMSKNIILNHGPLLKMYYAYGDGQKQVGDDEHIHGDPNKLKNAQWGNFVPYDFISEGDSPAFLHLVDVGLNNLNNPSYGGWGGRFAQAKDNPYRFEDNDEAADFNPELGKLDINYAQTRWLIALQQDFAARADWCIKDFKDANHAPQITVREGMKVYAKAGQQISLNLLAVDPDKQAVALCAWPYKEAGSGAADIQISGNKAMVKIPNTAKAGETYHVIIEGKDNGTPALTGYRRVVVNIL
ncbi:DUF1593 domain-containing protein [Aquirufa aurantiipilula]